MMETETLETQRRARLQEIEHLRWVIMKARRDVEELGIRLRLNSENGTEETWVNMNLVEDNLRRGYINRLEFLFIKEKIDIQNAATIKIAELLEGFDETENVGEILELEEDKENVEEEKEDDPLPDSPPPGYMSYRRYQQFVFTYERERRPDARFAGNDGNRNNVDESVKYEEIGVAAGIPNQRPVQAAGTQQSRNPRYGREEVVDQQPMKTFRSSPNPNNTSGNCDDPNGQPRQQQASGVRSSSIYPNLGFQPNTSAGISRARAENAWEYPHCNNHKKKEECCLTNAFMECIVLVYDCF